MYDFEMQYRVDMWSPVYNSKSDDSGRCLSVFAVRSIHSRAPDALLLDTALVEID